MAALADQDRSDIAAMVQSDCSLVHELFGAFTKSDILAAVVAIDNFMVANAAAINNAFPAAFKNGATASQKARLVSAVMLKRYVKGA